MSLKHLLQFFASGVCRPNNGHAGSIDDDFALFEVFVISLQYNQEIKHYNKALHTLFYVKKKGGGKKILSSEPLQVQKRYSQSEHTNLLKRYCIYKTRFTLFAKQQITESKEGQIALFKVSRV